MEMLVVHTQSFPKSFTKTAASCSYVHYVHRMRNVGEIVVMRAGSGGRLFQTVEIFTSFRGEIQKNLV